MQTDDKGYVITASISAIRKLDCDEIWQITRSDKGITGTKWVPELAPGWDLYNQYLNNWKGKPPEEWWPLYEKTFNEELKSEVKLAALRRLWSLVNSGKVIALVCFCPDNTWCHRRLVAKFLEKHGIQTEEYTNSNTSFDESVTQPVLF
ncbi:MAG: DUF488 domain-containing protein [Syntrophomonadaceae bacterium]|nr:DUF488 domain-containing protein [Syntrophomonadaceae bacterium]